MIKKFFTKKRLARTYLIFLALMLLTLAVIFMPSEVFWGLFFSFSVIAIIIFIIWSFSWAITEGWPSK